MHMHTNELENFNFFPPPSLVNFKGKESLFCQYIIKSNYLHSKVHAAYIFLSNFNCLCD